MKSKVLSSVRLGLASAVLVPLLACSSASSPHTGPSDAGASDAVAIDAPASDVPPMNAVDLLSGSGQASSGSLRIDVQIGSPAAGVGTDSTRVLTTAPVVH